MIGKTVAVTVLVLASILLVGVVAHRWQVAESDRNSEPLGTLVSVNGHEIHLFSHGEGPSTVVFLAGAGTSSPVLDFKPLWQKVSANARITVVERAGYGFSPITKGLARDMRSVMEDSRSGLRGLQVEPPYDFVVHSMGMLEAMEWIRHYPDEVRSVTAIDPAVPEAYDTMELPPMAVLRLMAWASANGVTRLIPAMRTLPDVVSNDDVYTEEERRIYLDRLHTRTLTANMVAEVAAVRQSAAALYEFSWPTSIPLLVFASPGTDVGTPHLVEAMQRFADNVETVEWVSLPGSHYLHHQHAEEIAARMQILIQ